MQYKNNHPVKPHGFTGTTIKNTSQKGRVNLLFNPFRTVEIFGGAACKKAYGTLYGILAVAPGLIVKTVIKLAAKPGNVILQGVQITSHQLVRVFKKICVNLFGKIGGSAGKQSAVVGKTYNGGGIEFVSEILFRVVKIYRGCDHF